MSRDGLPTSQLRQETALDIQGLNPARLRRQFWRCAHSEVLPPPIWQSGGEGGTRAELCNLLHSAAISIMTMEARYTNMLSYDDLRRLMRLLVPATAGEFAMVPYRILACTGHGSIQCAPRSDVSVRQVVECCVLAFERRTGQANSTHQRDATWRRSGRLSLVQSSLSHAATELDESSTSNRDCRDENEWCSPIPCAVSQGRTPESQPDGRPLPRASPVCLLTPSQRARASECPAAAPPSGPGAAVSALGWHVARGFSP